MYKLRIAFSLGLLILFSSCAANRANNKALKQAKKYENKFFDFRDKAKNNERELYKTKKQVIALTDEVKQLKQKEEAYQAIMAYKHHDDDEQRSIEERMSTKTAQEVQFDTHTNT